MSHNMKQPGHSMKTILSIALLLLPFVVIATGCGGRDLYTPSSRLVGHWVADTGIKTEYYFSKIGSKTAEGTITEYDPRDGTVFVGKYSIFSETPDGNAVTLEVTWPGGMGSDLIDYIVQNEGKLGIMSSFPIEYVDDKTEPWETD